MIYCTLKMYYLPGNISKKPGTLVDAFCIDVIDVPLRGDDANEPAHIYDAALAHPRTDLLVLILVYLEQNLFGLGSHRLVPPFDCLLA